MGRRGEADLTASRPGRRRGRNTAASAGLLTSLDMLSMTRAALRLMGVERSRRPRTSRGTSRDRVEAVTAATKVVAPSLWTVSGTCKGSTKDQKDMESLLHQAGA